jgi:hypothetical protein
MNKKQFLNVMNKAAIVYDTELSKQKLDIYWRLLKQYTESEFSKAMNTVLRTSKFFPKPAEIIELIDPQPEIADIALEQAHNIISHVKQYGSSVWPDLSDPVTEHLMTRRWPYPSWAADLVQSEEKWWVKEFCEAYHSFNKIEYPGQLKQIAGGMFEEIE